MRPKTVVSNIRIPADEWNRIRINAAEMNMSINQYIRFVINYVSIKQELFPPEKTIKKDFPIWKIYQLSSKKKRGRGISAEDKIIYGDK